MADEELPVDPAPDAGDEEADEIADLASEITHDAKGNKMVSLSTMLKYKREGKALSRRIKELEPIAARAEEVNGRLDKAQPFIDAIVSDPKLRAAALRIANGTAPSRTTTEQPDAETDPDAAALAEDYGWYLP